MKLGKKFKAFATSGMRNPSQWLIEAFGGKPSKTGINVTIESSLGLAPVTYAVNKISGHIAQMPLEVYKYNAEGKKEKFRNNTYKLMNKQPNDVMTAFQFRELMMVHALMAGNGRAYIDRNSNGTPTSLIPVMPYNCQTMLVDGQKWHLVTQDAGTVQDAIPVRLKNGEYYKIPDRDMLHVMNTSYNGIWGMHVIDIARDVFGLTQAGQEGAAVSVANNAKPSMIIEAPNGMFRNPEDAKSFLDNFNEKHEGVDNAGRAGMLRDGMKATVLPMTSADSQFLQQRNFQREEVALLFGLESIIGDTSGQTYKSISERNTAYINNCLSRWLEKWTQEIERKLIGRADFEAQFDTSTLMRGDPNSVADYTLKMTQAGILTVNELRAVNNFDPIPSGDKTPMEMAEEAADKALEATANQEEETSNEPKETEDNTDEA
jgi:HK97 family phage portal protein